MRPYEPDPLPRDVRLPPQTRTTLAHHPPGEARAAAAAPRPLPGDVRLPPETGTTFADNALGKARAAASATGRPAVADDSGIEAAELGGAPGVWSARYAGEGATDEENLRKLLREVPEDGDRRV